MPSIHDVRYIESACVIAIVSALFNFPLSISDLILADMHFAIASSPLQPDSIIVASIRFNIHIFLILLTLFSSDDSSHLILAVV